MSKKLNKKIFFRALYIGRFQPFHLGHLQAIKYILNETKEVIIVIGSAQHSHTFENPFTAGERAFMVKLALTEAEINPSRYFIIPVMDLDIHGIWVAHLCSFVPKFDLVYSNEPLTKRLFLESNFTVKTIPFYKREVCSATEIRKRLISNKNWVNLIPKSIVKYIKEIDGINRLQDLIKTDKHSQK